MSIYFREVDLLDWDNLLDMNTQMGRHLVVPNVKVRSWSYSINSLNPVIVIKIVIDEVYWTIHYKVDLGVSVSEIKLESNL